MVVLDFGYTRNPDVPSSIHDLGDCLLRHKADLRADMIILAQSATYDYLCRESPTLAESGRLYEVKVVQSSELNAGGIRDGGSYFVLKRAKEMLSEMELLTTAYDVYLLAHQVHLPRAKRQAYLVGFSWILPYPDVPDRLYSAAAQWWCRSRFLWNLRELVGYIPLKLAGQI